MKMNLTHQINAQKEVSEASRQQERRADLRFIQETQKVISLEA